MVEKVLFEDVFLQILWFFPYQYHSTVAP